jgi:hypothetical protein
MLLIRDLIRQEVVLMIMGNMAAKLLLLGAFVLNTVGHKGRACRICS